MNPPRPNEGIDVEVREVCLKHHIGLEAMCDIRDLVTRLRAETEAVVTKREREKAKLLIGALLDVQYVLDAKGLGRTKSIDRIIAAYESNDAGESKNG